MAQDRANAQPSAAGEVWEQSGPRRSYLQRSNLPPVDPTVHHIVVTTLEPINADTGDWMCLVVLDTYRDDSSRPSLTDRGTGKRVRFRIQSRYGWLRVS